MSVFWIVRAFLAVRLLLAALALVVALPMSAKPIRVEAVEVELVANRDAIVAGQPITLGLRVRHDPKWHTYWRNPGDSGLPTLFPLSLPDGYVAGLVQWPAPHRIPVGPLLNFGYDGDLILPVTVQVPTKLAAGEQVFATKAQWLMCKDVCIPGEADLTLSLPVAAKQAQPSSWSSLFETMSAASPQLQLTTNAALIGSKAILLIELPAASGSGKADFFPYGEGLIRNSSPQALDSVDNAGKRTELLAITLAEGVNRAKLDDAGFFTAPAGVLVRDNQVTEIQAKWVDPPPAWSLIASNSGSGRAGLGLGDGSATTSADEPLAPSSLGSLAVALLFAGAGGLILNLMPCVFPVIGLKVLGFVGDTAGGGNDSGSGRAWRHALAFAGGVLLSFWLLAAVLLLLRSAGQALGWGFQLQSPLFIVAMALLFLAIGLNFSGVFEFGAGLTRLAEHDRGSVHLTSSFGSGCLAVLVATPCTAPFMGSALGFAMTQPALPTALIFTAMAFGMALPYLLLGAFPSWTRLLPKPGRWMQSFRQLLAFPMYLTVVWLAWVLVLQAGVDSLLALGFAAVALAMAAWLYGTLIQNASKRSAWSWLALALMTLITLALADRAADGSTGSTSLTATANDQNNAWLSWSNDRVAQALAQGKPVFIDFTAAWCVTCQVNKKVVLERPAIVAAMEQLGVVRLRADWTQRNVEIGQALARLGRNGVPVYVLHLPGQKSPRLLPELLTQAVLLEALRAAN